MTNVKLDVKIMGVFARIKYIKALKEKLGLSWEDCILDDRGDRGGGDAWYNAKRAWTAPIPPDATHRLVIQDDAIVCDGFLDAVKKCVTRYPEAAWSFYNKHTIRIRKTLDTPYFRQNGGQTGGVALLLPIDHISRLIDWSDSIFGREYKHDDSRFGWYCQANGVLFMGVYPTLTDHRAIESNIPHHNDKRRRGGDFRADISDVDFDAAGENESAWCLPYIWLNEKDPHYAAAQRMADGVKNARKKKEQLK